jgi:uncharacterized protein (DUF433 family)
LHFGAILRYDFNMAANLNASVEPLAAPLLSAVVERDVARLGGEPVFHGTRVPIKSLFDHLRAGDPLQTFLDDFPGVTREQAQAVLDMAAAQFLAEMRAR